MPTLFDKNTQLEMLARVHKLTPASQRKWGKMSVSQMLKHMINAFTVPVSNLELPKEPLYYIAANPFGRWLMIRALTKWPRNLVTPESFKIKDDPEFEVTRKEFLAKVDAFVNATNFDGRHPVFGVMSKELWGEAMYIHLNHHLEQFGV
jgi:hypothetical protein